MGYKTDVKFRPQDQEEGIKLLISEVKCHVKICTMAFSNFLYKTDEVNVPRLILQEFCKLIGHVYQLTNNRIFDEVSKDIFFIDKLHNISGTSSNIDPSSDFLVSPPPNFTLFSNLVTMSGEDSTDSTDS